MRFADRRDSGGVEGRIYLLQAVQALFTDRGLFQEDIGPGIIGKRRQKGEEE